MRCFLGLSAFCSVRTTRTLLSRRHVVSTVMRQNVPKPQTDRIVLTDDTIAATATVCVHHHHNNKKSYTHSGLLVLHTRQNKTKQNKEHHGRSGTAYGRTMSFVGFLIGIYGSRLGSLSEQLRKCGRFGVVTRRSMQEISLLPRLTQNLSIVDGYMEGWYQCY